MTKEQLREMVAARFGRPATDTDIAQYAIDAGVSLPGGVYECTAPLRVVKGLNWKPVGTMQPDHFRADTRHGVFFIGPRKSDGAWEYSTPDENWGEHDGHTCDDLTREQAFAAVEAEFASREHR